MKIFGVIFLLFGAFLPSPLRAEDDPVKPITPVTSSFILLPVVYYTPETKIAGGVAGLFAFHPPGSSVSGRPTSLRISAIYTQMKQYSIYLEPEIYLDNERYILGSKITIKRFPSKYWGLGNSAPAEAEEEYTPRTILFEGSVLRKVVPKWDLFAGILFHFENFAILNEGFTDHLTKKNIPGGNGGWITGFGAAFNRDTRDNVFYPQRGEYMQFITLHSIKALGGEFGFTTLKWDIRKYLPLSPRHTLGLQGYIQTVFGNPPFHHYAMLGGDSMMRGYYRGRYRDKCLAAFQAEIRTPVWKRIGLVGFAGFGNVAPALGKLDFTNLKLSAGFGLRFKAVPKEGMNVRLDVAFGDGRKPSYYITAGESF